MSREFEGAKVFKAQGQLNRQVQNTDAYMALVAFVPVFPAEVAANDIIEAIQVEDLEAVGINASYDANNNVLVHYHAQEFFRLAPEGKLIVILTDQPTAEDYFQQAVVSETFKTYSDVKRIGFVYNAEPLGLTMEDEAIVVQDWINAMAADHYLIDGVYLEARNIGTAGGDARQYGTENLHLVIAQDPAIAAIDAAYTNYAAVGSVLGMRAVRNPSENLGSVGLVNYPDNARGNDTYPLTSDVLGRWQKAALSDGTPFDTLSKADKQSLTDEGYIYAGAYSNFDGVYFNAEPTCTALDSDYAHGENNNIWNAAARGIRTALLPKVKSKVKVDPDSGYIRNTSAKYLETVARKPLLQMLSADLISGESVQIPLNQSPSDQTPLQVNAAVTMDGIIHVFEVTLGIN